MGGVIFPRFCGLLRRSVEEVRHVGLDEKRFRRGQSYISVLVDIDAEAPRVLAEAEGRTQADAELLLEELPESQRAYFRWLIESGAPESRRFPSHK